jgi:hypothetical protein
LSSLDPPGSVLPCPSTPISWSSITWEGIMGTLWGLNVATHCPTPHRTCLQMTIKTYSIQYSVDMKWELKR